MAEDSQIPSWIESRDWDTCILGDVIIPGIVDIDNLEVGIDVDTKKAKGADKPTSTDNGLRPSKFTIRVWLNGSQWPEFQAVASSFQPRRPGRARQPLQIIHPLVNFLGIREVRVAGIKMDSPTAKGGMRVGILCEEWFDKPKPVKKQEEPKIANPKGSINTIILQEVRQRAAQGALSEMSNNNIDPVTGQSVDPSDPEIVAGKYF